MITFQQFDYNIRQDILKRISVPELRKFCKENNIDAVGFKEAVVRNVLVAVQEQRLDQTTVREFLKEQLWYGYNRHIFFIGLDDESLEVFRDEESLIDCFSNITDEPFNNLDNINLPNSPVLGRFEFDLENEESNIVKKIYIGFVETCYQTGHFNGEAIFTPTNTYICIEIDLENKLLILRVRPQIQLRAADSMESDNVSPQYLAKKYVEMLTNDYNLKYLKGAGDEFKNTMFNINQELTGYVFEVFRQNIKHVETDVNSFSTSIASKLNFPSETDPVDLNERIFGLLVRGMIALHPDVVEKYSDGKIGYIYKFDFRDDTGGKINARSGHKDEAIQSTDIFFDTKETVDEVGMLDSLSVVWFKNLGKEEEFVEEGQSDPNNFEDDIEDDVPDIIEKKGQKIKRVATKLISFKSGLFKIEFRPYVIKEEYDYVFSQINRFKGL